MNSSLLKSEIERVLGLAGPQAADFWRNVAARPAAASAFEPRFVGGTGVAPSTTGPARQLTAGHKFTLSQVDAAPSPVPVPYPNFAADLLACVVAAVNGDAAAARVRPLWLKVRLALEREPKQVRRQHGHDLSHRLARAPRH